MGRPLRFPKHARPHVDSASHLFFSVFSVFSVVQGVEVESSGFTE